MSNEVKVGQLYRDNDPRSEGRTLRIADVASFGDDGAPTKFLCQVGATGQYVKILTRRLQSRNSRGYTLIRDEHGKRVAGQ